MVVAVVVIVVLEVLVVLAVEVMLVLPEEVVRLGKVMLAVQVIWVFILEVVVVLEPLEKSAWPEGYWERLEAVGPLPDDFVAPEPLPPTPHRDDVLDDLGG